jgi:hypothetical protein
LFVRPARQSHQSGQRRRACSHHRAPGIAATVTEFIWDVDATRHGIASGIDLAILMNRRKYRIGCFTGVGSPAPWWAWQPR